MAFRSIGKIAAEMAAKSLGNSPFPLKQTGNAGMVKDEPDRCWKHRPGSEQAQLKGSRECL